MNAKLFSTTYQQARQRFREAAESLGAQLSSYALDVDQDLTTDVAILGGSDSDHAIVISSGTHGVEGFLGSAVQLAWLQQAAATDSRVVLIHAVNPFGFAHGRRSNEDNVDLNRNFHRESSAYNGSPEMYQRLDPLLNPSNPPRRFDTFQVRFLLSAMRYGIPAIKAAIAGGQYDFPQGLFFGGRDACQTTRLIENNMESWIGDAKSVIQLDFHSGLGTFADYRLLLLQPKNDPACDWYRRTFDANKVEPLADADGVASYVASGAMGSWLRDQFAGRNYRFVTPEFGTYSPLRVLAALRAENQTHFHNEPTDEVFHKAKLELIECFCPRDARWRATVVESGLKIIHQAMQAFSDERQF